MQPNDDRTDEWINYQNVENVGWSGSYKITSDTLRYSDYNVELNNLDGKVPADSHTIVRDGYSNFPGYIPNYAGDEDSGLEAVVPSVVRLNKNVGRDLIESLNLDYDNNYVNPQITGVTSTGTTIRLWVDNLYGLKAGDTVYADNSEYSFPDFVTISSVGNVEGSYYLETVVDEAPESPIDVPAQGTVWPYGDLYDIILLQDIPAGEIVDEGTSIEITMLGD